MSKTDFTLTHERLLELLNYDRETGLFIWKTSRSNGIKVGDIAGFINHGYRRIFVEGTFYQSHRLAWFYCHGAWPEFHIDHLNGNPSDNRLANLRDVPHCLNLQNQRTARSDNKLGFQGVTRDGTRFRSTIRVNGKKFHLGNFIDQASAHAAYVAAKRLYHPGCTI
jgi:hypothetical protein